MEGIHYSKEIEAAVLGICMMEKTAFGRTFGLIDEPVFYLEDNQKVYAAIKSLYDVNLPVDMLTVWEQLNVTSVKLNAGDLMWYVTKITTAVVSSAHLEYHCHLLKKMWRKRELEKLTAAGIDPMDDERQQALEIQRQIQEILGTEVKRDWCSMDELMYELFMHQQQIATGEKTFLTTGFRSIDKLNGGFSPGQSIIIGARPGFGKSALSNSIATRIAKQNKVVGIISLEMNNNEIAARLAAIETDTDFGIIYRNLFRDEREHEAFYNKISNEVINLPIYISDKTKVDVAEIRSKAMKLKHKHGLDVLIVDYLQLVETTGGNKNYNREQEVSKISRGFKLMAMELQIPVITLCQLNRESTKRTGENRFPKLSDLRESGAIEQDADIVFLLHRDYMSGLEFNPEHGGSTEHEAHLVIAKWRNGQQGIIEMDFDGGRMKFSEKGSSLIPIPKQAYEDEAF